MANDTSIKRHDNIMSNYKEMYIKDNNTSFGTILERLSLNMCVYIYIYIALSYQLWLFEQVSPKPFSQSWTTCMVQDGGPSTNILKLLLQHIEKMFISILQFLIFPHDTAVALVSTLFVYLYRTLLNHDKISAFSTNYLVYCYE